MPEGTSIAGAGKDTVVGARPFQYGGRLAYTQPNTPEMSAALYRRQVMSSEALLMDDPGTGRLPASRRSSGGDGMSNKHVSFDAASSPSSPTSSEIYTAAVPANASKSTERLLDIRSGSSSRNNNADAFVSSGLGKSKGHQQQQQQQGAFSPVLARAILLGNVPAARGVHQD